MTQPTTTKPSSANNISQKNEEGLPDIAETKNHTALVLVILVLTVIIIVTIYVLHKTSSVNKPVYSNDSFSENDNTPSLTVPSLTPSEIAKVKAAVANAGLPPRQPDDNEDIQKAILMRLQAPIIVDGQNNTDNSNTTTAMNSVNSADQSNNNKNASTATDPNSDYLNQTASQGVDTVSATILQNRDTLIAEGNLIHAILEPPINSDLPGLLRAEISEPVYSEDGSQILIQRGSRLIGQYKSGMLAGQNRIFMVWTRIIEPNGISIQIGSPGVDSLGEAGQGADSIDYHFWQMFGTATLLSILSAGASNVGVNDNSQYNSSQEYRQAVSQSLAQSSSNSLQQYTTIPPTLHINQGVPIMVFVAKDLRFDMAMQQAQQRVNIF